MRAIKVALSLEFVFASLSVVSAAPPSDPSGFGGSTATDARADDADPGIGSDVSGIASSAERGYAPTRMEATESLPVPQNSNPNAPLQVPVGFF